jgi:hypothetical protein
MICAAVAKLSFDTQLFTSRVMISSIFTGGLLCCSISLPEDPPSGPLREGELTHCLDAAKAPP